MASPELMLVLKAFKTNLASGKDNCISTSISSLYSAIGDENSGFSEDLLKGVFKCLQPILDTYKNSSSRHSGCQLVKLIAQKYPTSVKQFVDASQKYVSFQRQCRSAGGLDWLVWSFELPPVDDKNVMMTLRRQQAIIHQVVASCQRGSVLKSLTRAWKRYLGDDVDTVRAYVEAIAGEEDILYYMSFAGFLFSHYPKAVSAEFKRTVVDGCLKALLSCKTVPPSQVLSAAKGVLRICTSESFSKELIPAAKRFMLRSPEVTIHVLLPIIDYVTLDLSDFAAEIVKWLGAEAHAKDEDRRAAALLGIKHLALHCGKVEAMNQMIKHLVAVMNGSDGKVTVLAERLDLLEAVRNLACNGVAGPLDTQAVVAQATSLLLKFISDESNETVLVRAISVLADWSKLITKHSPELLAKIKTTLSKATTSSDVRVAYLELLVVCFHTEDALTNITDFASTLSSLVTAGLSQTGLVNMLAEAALSALVLQRLIKFGLVAGDSDEAAYQKLTKASNLSRFRSDKFLLGVSSTVLTSICSLAEGLLTIAPKEIDAAQSTLLLEILLATSCHTDYTVRQRCQTAVRKLIISHEKKGKATEVIRLFQKLINSLNWDEYFDENALEKTSVYFSAKGFTETLKILLTNSTTERELNSVLLSGFISAHHRAIRAYTKKLWVNAMQKNNIKPEEFVQNNIDKLVELIAGHSNRSSSHTNALQMLLKIDARTVVPVIMSTVKSNLYDADIYQVTTDEYVIFNLPEGELFNSEDVDKLADDEFDTRNLRKESKLYSYEEQLMEIELKRELAAKRGAPKLNKKQQERKKTILEAEAAVRRRVAKLNDKVKCSAFLLNATVQSKDGQPFYPEFCNCIEPLLRHRIVAHHMCSIFIDILQLTHGLPGERYAITQMLHDGAVFEIPEQWRDEDPLLLLIHSANMIADASPYTTCEFGCLFPLIKTTITHEEVPSNIKLKLVRMFTVHADFRSETEDDGPAVLPRTAMLEVLFQILVAASAEEELDETETEIVSEATLAVERIAACASGDDGCTVAEFDEIDVLLCNLVVESDDIRTTALKCLTAMMDVLPIEEDEQGLKVMGRIWQARFDLDEVNVGIATELWENLGLDLNPKAGPGLVSDIASEVDCLQIAASDALAAMLEEDTSEAHSIMKLAIDIYNEKLEITPELKNVFGRIIQPEGKDYWKSRSGVGRLCEKIATLMPGEDLEMMVRFFIPKAVADRNPEVGSSMRTAALALVEHHGKDHMELLLPLISKLVIPKASEYNIARQSVVVLMGSLAKHLDKEDPRVKDIVTRLIADLNTHSQSTQLEIGKVLPPLLSAVKEDLPNIRRRLMSKLLSSNSSTEKRGAGFAIACIVKSNGILALKQLDLMTELIAAVQNKQSAAYRQGALIGFETFSILLGRLFEPYVVNVFPYLVGCFQDTSGSVAGTAFECGSRIVGKLSAHGIKLVLPLIMNGLKSSHSRAKISSIDLLGAMAQGSPKQMSDCLAQIVPRLVDLRVDTNLKISQAGIGALKKIGNAIRNPEIKKLVPPMIRALNNPAKHTTACLEALSKTNFTHFIDAPSVALMMPVITRALDDNRMATRRMACQIIGNMYALTDQKDLTPYLTCLMPGLQHSLLDPVPDVRSMAAAALGAMVKGISEQEYNQLQPWLMRTLTADTNSVDRSGAAQGLSEVIGALGTSKLREIVHQIVQTCNKPNLPPHVRDGYIMMFIYLPITFGDDFLEYIGIILPTVLRSLADENEYVRDTALRAGQRMVNMYAEKSIELLLPELELGLFDENWRIRLSSIHLLGDILYKVSGITGLKTTETADDDDNFGTEAVQEELINILGQGRRDRVLSGLYMGRSDIALGVRQAALHVWKVVVMNTPRTLHEILPVLFSLLLGCLASSNLDKRQIGARTMGDVVKKLGHRVLPEIMPVLEAGIKSNDPDKRQGVCIGLTEIMKNTTTEQIQGYSPSLIKCVSKALSDQDSSVRRSGAKTFDHLQNKIGQTVIDQILPGLILLLDDPQKKQNALDGLKQCMVINSDSVLPYLLPKLLRPPVNTRALSNLAGVAGPALEKELPKVLQALRSTLADALESPSEEAELSSCTALLNATTTAAAVRTVLEEVTNMCSTKDVREKAAAAHLLCIFCRDIKVRYSEYMSQLFRLSIGLLAVDEQLVLAPAWETVNAIVKKLDPSAVMFQVQTVRQALRYACSDLPPDGLLPGFCLPKKGLTCLLPVFREGLLSGAPDLKTSSALGLGDAIRRTSADALKQSVVHITGPLIRVLGDRYASDVRVAMLLTIHALLVKCGPMLKPFLPQLQTTLLKALNDANREVRLRSAEALSELIVIHVRVDPVFNDLNTGSKNVANSEADVRGTYLHALRLCLVAGGKKASVPVLQDITKTLLSLIMSNEDTLRVTAGACLGALCVALGADELAKLLKEQLFNTSDPEWMLLHGRSVALFVAIKELDDSLLETYRKETIEALMSYMSSIKVPVAQYGIRCCAQLIKTDLLNDKTPNTNLYTALTKGMKSDSNDVKCLVGQSIELICRAANASSSQRLDSSLGAIWIPTLVNGCLEKNSAVKASCEYALVTLLQLRRNDSILKGYLGSLEPGKANALSDVAGRYLKKHLKQKEPVEDEYDVTLLK